MQIRAAAAELPAVNLHDALAILPLIANQEPERYDRAACRFLARLILERRLELEQVGVALAALDRLPDTPAAADVLAGLAQRYPSAL